MEAARIIGGVLFWAFIIGGLYLKTVETSSASRSQNVKRNRFLLMLLLWLIAPVLGAGLFGGLVADSGAPEWMMLLTITIAIFVQWLLAIRLQIKWGQRQGVIGKETTMHPAARVFLGFFALWTLVKVPLLFTAAEQTRKHLSDAPSEIRKTLRSTMIGRYGTALLNVTILIIVGAVVITGSTSFIKDSVTPLIAVFVIGLVTGAMGIKASFDSLHNPEVTEFYRRYGIQSSRLFRRGKQLTSENE